MTLWSRSSVALATNARASLSPPDPTSPSGAPFSAPPFASAGAPSLLQPCALDLRGILLSTGPVEDLILSRFRNLAEFTFEDTSPKTGFLAAPARLLSLNVETLEIKRVRADDLPTLARALRRTAPHLRNLTLKFSDGWVDEGVATEEDHEWLAGTHEVSAFGELQALKTLRLTLCGRATLQVLDQLRDLEELEVVTDRIEWVLSCPRAVKALRSLEVFRGGEVEPESLLQFSRLTRLALDRAKPQLWVEDRVSRLQSLRVLVLRNSALSEGIGRGWHQLRTLELGVYGLLPDSLRELTLLEGLRLWMPAMWAMWVVPEWLGNLTALTELEIGLRSIEGRLPESLGRLTRLRSFALRVDYLRLTEFGDVVTLPQSVGEWRSLETLALTGATLAPLPSTVGQWTRLTSLALDFEHEVTLPRSAVNWCSLEKFESAGDVTLADGVGWWRDLVRLSGGGSPTLSESAGNWVSLVTLRLICNSLPDSAGQWTRLRRCDLDLGRATTLPESVGGWRFLTGLTVCGRYVSRLPNGVGGWRHLRDCSLQFERCETLPESVGDWRSLESLKLNIGGLRCLPGSVGRWSCLRRCDLKMRDVETLPDSVGEWQSLEVLRLSSDSLSSLPSSVGRWTYLRQCKLDAKGLEVLPESIGNWRWLKDLSLQCRTLSLLPAGLCGLSRLRYLGLTGCHSVELLPEDLGSLGALERILVKDCPSLVALPEDVSGLTRLETLHLVASGKLTRLPEGIAHLPRLRILECPEALRPRSKQYEADAFGYHLDPVDEAFAQSSVGSWVRAVMKPID